MVNDERRTSGTLRRAFPTAHLVAQRMPMKHLAMGAALIAATTLAGGVCATVGLDYWSIVVVVLLGIGMFFVAGVEQPLRGMAGVVITVACGIGAAQQQQAPLLGRTVTGIGVTEAPSNRAAFYRFTDGQVLTDHVGDADVWAGGRNTHYVAYTLHVAPLVGPGWTPATPIPAWVITAPHQRVGQALWSVPLRAAVTNTVNGDEARHAIQSVKRRYGVTAFDTAPVLRWVADPLTLQVAEWRRLGVITTIGATLWGLAVAGFALWRRWQNRRAGVASNATGRRRSAKPAGRKGG